MAEVETQLCIFLGGDGSWVRVLVLLLGFAYTYLFMYQALSGEGLGFSEVLPGNTQHGVPGLLFLIWPLCHFMGPLLPLSLQT
jgi:hypothetical protein